MATRSSLNAEQSNSPLQFPMDNNNHGIGVALGSPRLALVPGQDPSMVPRTMTTITSPAATVTEQQQQQQQQQQSKATGLSRSISKRLPFLGRSKSRRINSNNGGTNYSRPCADPSRANYISGTPTTPAPSPSVPMASSASANRARPDAAKLKKQKPLGARSLTDPQMQPQSGNMPQTLAWTPGQPGLMLDVEIPDISFERYSVMFESLIEKQQQSASNLLARRQATLARIKANDDDRRREHSTEVQRSRRATSPAATPIRTPIAEPSAEDSAPDINIVPLRLRSNTFPMIASQSPRALSPEDETDSPGASLLSPDSQFSLAPDSEGRRLLHSKFHKPSVESIHSPYFRHTTERETATALSPPPCSTRRLHDGGGGSSSNVATPVYTMMPPAKQIDIPSRSTSLRNTRKLPAAAAAAASPKPKPNPKPASVEEALEDAAEVSIARQISISRGQRRFLEPLHERERRRARANQHIKAASQISLDDGKRIAETKTATPTVIHPDREQPDESSASPRQHMYRRSEQVTIEGA
ncbi:hypothetical protein BBO_03468 [Beauveria brongniartii RCEF 3172]|uniref:Uncharacterized protein n=1 Tax=Beauveria brongniartii RCEF 3172 TaxID=1081107 RepID=A0A167FW66_9HYPO|nr:hypothetical protein BBO_03468 [Beauveria brongniartii RCEF 3172]